MNTAPDVVDLGAIARSPLRPQQLRVEVVAMAGGLAMLQLFAQQVLQQPLVDTGGAGEKADPFPALRRHQQAARGNATAVLNSVGPAVIESLTTLAGFANQFDVFTTDVFQLLPRVPTDPDARRDAEGLVSDLEQEAARREGEARRLEADVRATAASLERDRDDLSGDLKEVRAAVESKGGDLDKLQDEISELRTRIDGQIAGVVVSALTTVAGGVTLLVGIFATFATAGTSIAVVSIGATAIAGGAGGLSVSAAQLRSDNVRLRALYERSAELSTSVTLAGAIAGQAQSLSDTAAGAVGASGKLAMSWGSIREGLSRVREDVARASDATETSQVAAALRVARADWEAVREEVVRVLDGLGGLQPRVVESLAAAEEG